MNFYGKEKLKTFTYFNNKCEQIPRRKKNQSTDYRTQFTYCINVSVKKTTKSDILRKFHTIKRKYKTTIYWFGIMNTRNHTYEKQQQHSKHIFLALNLTHRLHYCIFVEITLQR